LKEGSEELSLSFVIGERETEGAALEQEVEGIGGLLLQQQGAVDPKAIAFVWECHQSDYVTFRIEAPPQGMLSGMDPEFGTQDPQAGNPARMKAQAMGCQSYRPAVPVFGDVIDPEQHENRGLRVTGSSR
jgi:hypothetical protein